MELTKISPEIIKEISQWYWTFGSKRTGVYGLSRGAWLDKVLRTLHGYSDILYSEKYFARPSIAVWGPSQSGKSTLLASFIDHGNGALNWDEKSKFKFVSESSEDRFNPNNRGSDASGCVTRYVMREKVEHPEAPVEICFVEERDILMSLAFGYLSEMDGKARDGKRKSFDEDSLSDLLENISKETKIAGKTNKEHFPLLVAVVDVIEALIKAKQSRYSNLEAQWARSRSEILNCDALLVSKDAVLNFAAEVFWDGWGSLTNICKMLVGEREKLRSRYGNKHVFCSLKFASILLDIAAAENKDVQDSLSDFGEKELGEDVVFVKGGRPLFFDKMDFALRQALVAVLVVPLKKSVIEEANSALGKLLETADLVDFPGVANEAKAADDALLTDDDVRENQLLGLTRVLKRGKTASIVIGYSRNLNIDVFAILMRMNVYSPKPEQLKAGIASWFDAMLQKPFNDSTAAELPINIVQTFASKLVNSVCQNAIGKDGLKEIFEKNKNFGTLCKPGKVKYFAINYPAFKPDCDFSVSGEKLEEKVRGIENEQFFKKYYEGTTESLRQMCGIAGPGGDDGGRTYLFKHLLEQVKQSRREELLDSKKVALKKDFVTFVNEALPQDGDESARRKEDIERIRNGINERVSAGDCDRITRAILEFTNVRPEDLKTLPSNVLSRSQDAESALICYCDEVIGTVKSSLERARLGADIGLDDDSVCVRMISYFIEKLNSADLKKWIRENFSMLNNESGRRMALRRPLALYLSAKLLRRSGEEQHRPLENVQSYLRDVRAAVEEGDYRLCPGYTAVVGPFLKTLETLAGESATARGVQAGDDELKAILEKLKV